MQRATKPDGVQCSADGVNEGSIELQLLILPKLSVLRMELQ